MDKYLLRGGNGYVEFTLDDLLVSDFMMGYDYEGNLLLKNYTFDSKVNNIITYWIDGIF